MRRITLVLLSVVLAVLFLASAAFSEDTASEEQYANEDTTAEQTATEGTTPEESSVEESAPPVPIETLDEPASKVSQGSIAEGPGLPEENFPAYSQVVDNDSKGSFKAPGWKTESSLDGHHGKDYAVAQAGKRTKAAQYRVEIPATDKYSVYAWWPAKSDNSSAARFGVTTASGTTKWTQVNEQRDGGFWVKIGEYRMKKGQSYAIKIAPGSKGRTVADAVAVVRGVLSNPPEDDGSSGGDITFQAAGSGDHNGRDVLRKARSYKGIPYRYATCTDSRMSCTCLTKRSFKPFGHRKMPMTEGGQWKYANDHGRRVSKSSLKAGDLLFFKEGGSSGGITHVGVYAGGGKLVHASSYFGRVVESEMKYINGFSGAVRMRLR